MRRRRYFSESKEAVENTPDLEKEEDVLDPFWFCGRPSTQLLALIGESESTGICEEEEELNVAEESESVENREEGDESESVDKREEGDESESREEDGGGWKDDCDNILVCPWRKLSAEGMKMVSLKGRSNLEKSRL